MRMNKKLKNLKWLNGRKVLDFVGFLPDDEPQECLECKFTGKVHAEFEVEGLEEAEVVCPKCASLHYYIV
jgi:DnaJ-class molecular chaperone